MYWYNNQFQPICRAHVWQVTINEHFHWSYLTMHNKYEMGKKKQQQLIFLNYTDIFKYEPLTSPAVHNTKIKQISLICFWCFIGRSCFLFSKFISNKYCISWWQTCVFTIRNWFGWNEFFSGIPIYEFIIWDPRSLYQKLIGSKDLAI